MMIEPNDAAPQMAKSKRSAVAEGTLRADGSGSIRRNAYSSVLIKIISPISAKRMNGPQAARKGE